ncbi:MAG: methyltransferase domain-containing protein [Gammaproteobacteria bacterium]|jgi:phosphatidylethanolamine/phosphatidyl-N-methylethanolamine N-methyltransferase
MRSIANVLNTYAIFCQSLLQSVWCKSYLRSSWLFLVELIKRPGAVGAVWPSSRALAFAMARQLPAEGTGLIVELGAGTGSVTAALLESGIPPGRLLIVERSPAFVQHLRRQFPKIKIIQGDATQLQTIVPENTGVDAIVSSLPLRSLAAAEVSAVVEQWRRVLGTSGIVVQFTYDLRGLINENVGGFMEQAKCLVWKNIPPARVSKLSRCRCTETICNNQAT